MVVIFSIVAALTLIILNIVVGHYLAPMGIFTTAILLPGVTALVLFLNEDFKPFLKAIIVYVIFALNDFGIKLYAGGTHDLEGLGWMMMFTIAGLLPSFIILISSVKSDNTASLKEKILSIVLFIVLLAIHQVIFGRLGLGRSYPV